MNNMRYAEFLIFIPAFLDPVYACLDHHLVVFIIVQNLAAIRALGSVICKF